MTHLLKLESLALAIAAYCGILWLGYSWWLFFALFLLPDLSMVGYLVNTKVGAWAYNLVHHQAVGFGVLAVGWLIASNLWMLAGLVLIGHSAVDRVFGYGLKYPDHFQHTHLGWIGKGTERGNGS